MTNFNIKNMSSDFLFQAVKVLHLEQNNIEKLYIVYEFIKQLDDVTLFLYSTNKTIISYNSDLDLLIELIDGLIKIFETENIEEYEKCNELMKIKKDILNNYNLEINN